MMGVGAAFFGSLVLLSVATDLSSVWTDAGYYGLVVLAFPAFMWFAVKRGWGD